jgi:hypothetical protein
MRCLEEKFLSFYFIHKLLDFGAYLVCSIFLITINMNEIDNGPLVTEAMVCPAKGEPLVLKEIVLPPLTVNQVQVDIDFCGLCHTDIHMKGKAVS